MVATGSMVAALLNIGLLGWEWMMIVIDYWLFDIWQEPVDKKGQNLWTEVRTHFGTSPETGILNSKNGVDGVFH